MYFRFSSRFCANAAHWGPGHGVSELHGEGLHDVGDPLEVELVEVVGGVGEDGGAPDDRLRGVKVAIFYPVFLPPLVFCIFFWYSFGIFLGGRGAPVSPKTSLERADDGGSGWVFSLHTSGWLGDLPTSGTSQSSHHLHHRSLQEHDGGCPGVPQKFQCGTIAQRKGHQNSLVAIILKLEK